MSNKEIIISQLPSYFQSTAFMNDLASAIGGVLDDISAEIDEIEAQKFFDKITCAITIYEKDEGIIASGTLAERRAKVWSKWKKSNKNTLALLQTICDFWQDGIVKIKFIDGEFALDFSNDWTGMEILLDMLDEAKPAHLDYSKFIQTSKCDTNFLALSTIEEIIFIPIKRGNAFIWDNEDGTASTTTWTDDNDIVLSKIIPNTGANSIFDLSVAETANFETFGDAYADYKCSLKIKYSDTDIQYVYPDNDADPFPVIRVFAEDAEIQQPNPSDNVLLLVKKGQINHCQIYNPALSWVAVGNYLLEAFAVCDEDGYWS